MSEAPPDDTEIPLRGSPLKGWRWQDNELSVLFEPIIGRDASAIYCHLTGKVFGNKVTYTLRGLAAETRRSRTTIWRAMTVLKHIGLVRISFGGGNQASECSLVDLKKLAARLGALYDRRRASYVLAPSRIEEEAAKVAALLTTMQKKPKPAWKPEALGRVDSDHPGCVNLFLLDFKRDAGVSRKRDASGFAGETKTGSHLLRQNTRLQNIPSPNPPTHVDNGQKTKDSPDEDQSRVLLKWAQDRFNGVIDDMRAHLLDTSRPPSQRFANGFAEWEKFGFGSLAVERAARRGEGLALVLSASDPAAAREGLKKYHRTWEPSLRTWYGRKVEWEIQETKQTWWNAHREEPEPGG